MSGRDAAPQRGGTLVTVMLLMLLLGVAMMVVATQLSALARVYGLERGRVAADRLAESGLAHARALLTQDWWFRDTLGGQLVEGRYEFTVYNTMTAAVVVVCWAEPTDGNRLTLRTECRRQGAAVQCAKPTRTHGP